VEDGEISSKHGQKKFNSEYHVEKRKERRQKRERTIDIVDYITREIRNRYM